MDIFGLEKLSLVDYDGYVAATVFTGGCNFRCPFCHNSALVLNFKAIPPMNNQEVFSYLKKRTGILEGVCITGGEPTLNADIFDFAKTIKDMGFSVKIDTNGTNPQAVKRLAEEGLCDYFAIDIKNDRENYAPIIGLDKFDTANIEKTVDYLINGKIGYEFRTTLISEYHKKENILRIGEWIKGADKYFLQKFKSGDNCIKSGLTPIDTALAVEFAETVKPFVHRVSLRGYDL